MDIREQIAKFIFGIATPGFNWNILPEPTKEFWRKNYVDKLLSLPELKQALLLLDLQEQGKLYELDRDQDTPNHNKDTYYEEYYCDGWNDAESAMTKAGFRKVKQTGV